MSDNTNKEIKKETKKTGFVTGLKKEWKRITWLSVESLKRRTAVVAVFSVALGIMISVIDYAAQNLLHLIIH